MIDRLHPPSALCGRKREEMNRVEAIARAICLARNQDPDTYPAEHHSGLLVGADGRPGPWPEKPWMLRQQEAREFAMCFDAAMEQKK
jgi:hypothetical protein